MRTIDILAPRIDNSCVINGLYVSSDLEDICFRKLLYYSEMFYFQSHDDIYKYDDHKCITINAYMTMSTKLQARFCAEHSRQPLAIACSNCFSVSCVMCMTPTQMCNNGGECFNLGIFMNVEGCLLKFS